LDVGGTERQLVVLAKGLHKQGHDVAVMVFYANGKFEKELHESGIPVFDLRKSGRWDLLPFFIRAVQVTWKLKPRLIYAFLSTPNVLTAFLKPIFPSVRVVWGVRASNVDLDRYNWLSRASYRIECRLSRFADLIICNSRAGLEYAVAHGFPRRRMTVIPNGIDTERFKPDIATREHMRKEWGIAEHEMLIGLVARLDPMKDHSTFLRAASMLVQEWPDVRFVCVGDGSEPYKDELYHQAIALGLKGRLIWVSAGDDVGGIYNAVDLVTSCSSYGEGFSNVIAEALACGRPCVVTDVGDAKRIVGDTGYVVDPGNPRALVSAWQEALDMGCLEKGSRGQRARERVIEHFSLERLIGETARVLEAAVTTGS
jgi:glycosyltransferase involved in cell wall biosynthesis